MKKRINRLIKIKEKRCITLIPRQTITINILTIKRIIVNMKEISKIKNKWYNKGYIQNIKSNKNIIK